MKRSFFTLLSILIAWSGIIVASPAPDEEDYNKDPSPSNPGNRPKAPSLQGAYATQEGSFIFITLTRPEGECFVTIIFSDMQSQTFTIDSSAPMPIFIGENHATSIIVNTALGNTYYIEIAS